MYVDLIENPERFTGYSGHAARKVWRSVYEENCFSSNSKSSSPFSKLQWSKCMERKVFYRAISGMRIIQINILGLHSSISTHIASYYFNTKSSKWEVRPDIFIDRVGSYEDRVQNMYMVFLILYQAVCKIANHITEFKFSSKLNDMDDVFIKDLIRNIAESKNNYSIHLEQNTVFASNIQFVCFNNISNF